MENEKKGGKQKKNWQQRGFVQSGDLFIRRVCLYLIRAYAGRSRTECPVE